MGIRRTLVTCIALISLGLSSGCELLSLQGRSGGNSIDYSDTRREEGALLIEGVPPIPADLQDRLAPYQSIRTHSFQDWLLDGTLITTRFAQTSQAHHLTSPMGARRQLTFFDEPVRNVDASPGEDSFLFLRDVGGDEFYQGHVYRVEDDTVSVFTENGTRNGSMVWSDDGIFAAWYRAKDRDPDYDILIGNPIAPDSIRIAHEGDGALFPMDWSADGQQLLLQQYISAQHSRLFVLEINSGALSEIAPNIKAAYSNGVLMDDGSVLTLTDAGSEYRNLVRLDAAGNRQSFSDSINWDISEFTVSPDDQIVAFVVNENGLGRIRLLSLSNGSITLGPSLPTGIASGLSFSPDGKQVGFTFNAATAPADVWSFDIDSLEVTRWTRAETSSLSFRQFVEPSHIRYKNDVGMDVPAFVYRPRTTGPHPVIISIHGGPEGQARPYFSSTYQSWISELGAAIIVPNVRGSSGYGKSYMAMDNGLLRKNAVNDIGALLDWIATQPDLDPNRVALYGGSYGGYMVLASMIDHGDRLVGGVDIVGISDFTTFLTNTKGYRRDLRRAEYGDERDPTVRAFFDEISPLKNADKIDKPLFVIQGLNDPRVPASEAEQILEAVRANGTDAWYLLAKDEGHGFRKKVNQDFMREAVIMFFKEILAPQHAVFASIDAKDDELSSQ